jgi:hypothetical protein
MGLDVIEIVMGVEEFFGIEIPNKVAQETRTPGMLVDFVASVIETTPTDVCLSQQVFYRLRRGFTRQIAALASNAGLDTPLKDVLHKDQWPKVWSAVRADVGNEDWPASLPWAGFFRDGPLTMRDLVWRIVEHLPRPLAKGEAWTRVQIEAQVRRIIREVSGKEGFSLRADFVKELKLD